MKCAFILAAILVAAYAIPIKEEVAEGLKEEQNKNETMSGNSTTEEHSRPKRECDLVDLNKLQTRLTSSLEKQIELLLTAHTPTPTDAPAVIRARRDSSSAAGASSEVGADGKTKSTAFAKSKHTHAEKEKEPLPEAPAMLKEGGHPAEGHHAIVPVLPNGGDGGSGSPSAGGDGGMLHPLRPSGGLDGRPEGPAPMPGMPHPDGHDDNVPAQVPPKGNTVQNAKSVASKEKGIAVASAVAKREAVIQTVGASGHKAVVTAGSHKGAETNVQKLEADGQELGIASAVVDKKNASPDLKNGKPSGPEVTVQSVKAAGKKAVATAENKKGGNTMQDAAAVGENLAVASVTSSEEGDHPAAPGALGAMSKRDVHLFKTGDLDDIFDDDDDDNHHNHRVVLLHGRRKRELCTPLKMDDNLRLLIKGTVAQAFADIRKEALLGVSDIVDTD